MAEQQRAEQQTEPGGRAGPMEASGAQTSEQSGAVTESRGEQGRSSERGLERSQLRGLARRGRGGTQLQAWSPLRTLLGGLNWPLPMAFEDLFSDLPSTDVPVPPIDVTETDDAYIITAEIAGVDRDDLAVEFEGNVMTIRGEKRVQREDERDRARLLERSYGAFARALRLPDDADPDAVTAEFRNGVLRIHVAKREEARPRQVEIHG
jgi:HSP20 family protein